MALKKPSYRLGKPWRSGRVDRRNFITYLQAGGTKQGNDIPAGTLQDFDYEPLQDGDGAYLEE